jgi:hypothetical protein
LASSVAAVRCCGSEVVEHGSRGQAPSVPWVGGFEQVVRPLLVRRL